MAKILIIEDDKELSHLVSLELAHEGFETECAFDGREGLEKITAGGIDLVLLDVMLPRLSGLEVLRKVRGEMNSAVPVIMVTARGETIDKVDGLNSGADDYLAKPFKIEELLARMNAVLRRSRSGGLGGGFGSGSGGDGGRVLKNGSLELVAEEMRASVNRETKDLSKNEFMLLKFFLENVGKVLTRDEIIKKVWGEEYYIEENSVDVYVRHLRAKFGDSLIKTVRGMGYIMQSLG